MQSADTDVMPMEPSGRMLSLQDIQLVQKLIEKCLQLYMSQKEVIQTLHTQAKVEPPLTQLVWQKLEEQNPAFFQAYYLRLKVKDQVVLFNHLLDQQIQIMQRLHRSWLQAMPQMFVRPGMPRVPPMPGLPPGAAAAMPMLNMPGFPTMGLPPLPRPSSSMGPSPSTSTFPNSEATEAAQQQQGTQATEQQQQTLSQQLMQQQDPAVAARLSAPFNMQGPAAAAALAGQASRTPPSASGSAGPPLPWPCFQTTGPALQQQQQQLMLQQQQLLQQQQQQCQQQQEREQQQKVTQQQEREQQQPQQEQQHCHQQQQQQGKPQQLGELNTQQEQQARQHVQQSQSSCMLPTSAGELHVQAANEQMVASPMETSDLNSGSILADPTSANSSISRVSTPSAAAATSRPAKEVAVELDTILEASEVEAMVTEAPGDPQLQRQQLREAVGAMAPAGAGALGTGSNGVFGSANAFAEAGSGGSAASAAAAGGGGHSRSSRSNGLYGLPEAPISAAAAAVRAGAVGAVGAGTEAAAVAVAVKNSGDGCGYMVENHPGELMLAGFGMNSSISSDVGRAGAPAAGGGGGGSAGLGGISMFQEIPAHGAAGIAQWQKAAAGMRNSYLSLQEAPAAGAALAATKGAGQGPPGPEAAAAAAAAAAEAVMDQMTGMSSFRMGMFDGLSAGGCGDFHMPLSMSGDNMVDLALQGGLHVSDCMMEDVPQNYSFMDAMPLDLGTWGQG